MEKVVVDEFIRLHKKVFSVPRRTGMYIKMDKSVPFVWGLIVLTGVFYIISTQKWPLVWSIALFVLYMLSIIVGSLQMVSLVKKKYKSTHFFERSFKDDFIKKVKDELTFDLNEPYISTEIEGYLYFHLEKEQHRETVFSLFKPVLSLVIFLIPILIPFVITELSAKAFGLTVILTCYVAVFLIVSKALVGKLLTGLSRGGTLLAILELIHEEKVTRLKYEVLRERIESLLEQKEFEKTVKLLEEWPSDEWGAVNLSLLAPALHSMNGDVTWERVVHKIKEMG